MNIEKLIDDVDEQIIKIRTKSLDVSFNELYDMYQNGELMISPDYQRLFRWEEEKQSRFVESLLLEMPVPPIFVIETKEGIYELIDGLQRISSYLHFRGAKLPHADEETEEESSGADDSFLELIGCDIVPELNGLKFPSLPKVLQIKLKRHFVRMEVIKKESEPSLKYHMFKRLNTGGELLSAQEIRACTIRLLGSAGIEFLERCSHNPDFKSVIGRIGEERVETRFDQELVLRFLAMKNDLSSYKVPVTEYLTRYLEKMTTGEAEFDYSREEQIFQKTFRLVNTMLGEEAFSGKTRSGGSRNQFVLYYYDGIVVAISRLVDAIAESDADVLNRVKARIEEIKDSSQLDSYKTGSTAGVNGRIETFYRGVSEALDGR